jgi:hypothetical protein
MAVNFSVAPFLAMERRIRAGEGEAEPHGGPERVRRAAPHTPCDRRLLKAVDPRH